MATTYPGTIDSFTNPSGTSTLDSPDHSLQHSDANDAIEAIEAVIGTTAGTSVLKDFSAGEFAVRQEGGTVSPGTLTFDSPTLGTPAITGGTATGLTLAGTPVLDATSAIPFYGDSMARQAIINGNFDVWQRGTSVSIVDNTTTFEADRFSDFARKDNGTLPTLTRTKEVLTYGDIPNSFYYSRLTTNGAGSSLGTESEHSYRQLIENGTRYLCGDGKKVTVSFYARSSIANKRIGLYLFQQYGSGGSPTATEIINGTNWTLTSTWTKYTYTFTTNTLVGKTFGTANDDSLRLRLDYMWGSQYQSRYGSSTAETYGGSGTIDIAQVQLCAGDVVLPFMPKSFEEELRACQRYYEKSYLYAITPGTATQTGAMQARSASTYRLYVGTFRYITTKRTAVTPTLYSITGAINKISNVDDSNDISYSITLVSENNYIIDLLGGATANKEYQWQFTADAEL